MLLWSPASDISYLLKLQPADLGLFQAVLRSNQVYSPGTSSSSPASVRFQCGFMSDAHAGASVRSHCFIIIIATILSTYKTL